MILASAFLNVSSDAWTALGTWVLVLVGALTATVAGVAAFFAYRAATAQLTEAQNLRREQAQPYVVAFADENLEDQFRSVSIVVKNFGSTAATDVHVTITPEPDSVALGRDGDGSYRKVLIPAIPVLVPGQEWRTFWDYPNGRLDNRGNLLNEFPAKYAALVTFSDSKHQPVAEYLFDFDWNSIVNQYGPRQRSLPQIAENTQKISRAIEALSQDQRMFHGHSPIYGASPLRQASKPAEPEPEPEARWTRLKRPCKSLGHWRGRRMGWPRRRPRV